MDGSPTNAELNLALKVALQTMKERCAALQRRLSEVEAENQELHERISDKSNNTVVPVSSNGYSNGAAELFQARLQLADLQRQKAQLSQHVNMVAEENRQLWARLSQISKEHEHLSDLAKDADMLLNEAFSVSGVAGSSALTHQQLIRSKTFTQHAPNPNLRHKVLLGESGEKQSLEEVPLNKVGNLEQIATDNMGDSDLEAEAKKCYESLQELQRETKQQNLQLNTVINALGAKLSTISCAECAQRAQKPEMADKSLETDDSMTELQQYNNNNSNNRNGTRTEATAPVRLNIIQEKIQADTMDKTCPMCGRKFSSLLPFNDFREHVEQHFIDDGSDVEASIDRNFEFVSHAVGDF